MVGSDKRRWFRVTPRGLVPRTGKLLLGPKTTPIECRVVDMSAGGACLELQRTYDLPKRFEFLHGSTRTVLHPRVDTWFSHWHFLRGHSAAIFGHRRPQPTQEWRQPPFARPLDPQSGHGPTDNGLIPLPLWAVVSLG